MHIFPARASAIPYLEVDRSSTIYKVRQDEKKREKKNVKSEPQKEVKQVPKAKKQNIPAKVRTNVKVRPKIVRPKIKKH